MFEIRRRIRCSGARSTLSERIDSINKRRHQIQLAADAKWPASNSDNAPTRLFIVIAPKMKRVGENDVAEQVMRVIIRHIERRVYLEIARDIAGETDCR